jgi:predicted PurR-regulated permease PerM
LLGRESCGAGGLLYGAIGAFLALPAAAILQAGLSAYLTRHEVKTPKLTREQPQRSARTAKVAHNHVPLAGP